MSAPLGYNAQKEESSLMFGFTINSELRTIQMANVKLSVNINKYALLRNSRGHNAPNICDAIDLCLGAGAHGITIHPRRDQRHIRFDDVTLVSAFLAEKYPDTELNIECELHPFFLDMVLEFKPAQCTLVPVTPGEVTSDHGWNISKFGRILRPSIRRLKAAGIRTSIFMDCTPERMQDAAEVGTDRVELYTGPYAWAWGTENQADATHAFWESSRQAQALGLGVNAGHDLDRHNLAGIANAPGLLEVSIGHAQVCRALEVGTNTAVKELLEELR